MRHHRHIGSYGLILNNDEIVLIKKGRGPFTNKLDLPGGGFEKQENPIECVTREIKEETGMDAIEYELLDVFSYNIKWNDIDGIENLHHLGIIYKVKAKGIPNHHGDNIDSLGAYYFKIKDLTKEELTPFTIMGLEKLGYKIKEKSI